LGDAEFGQPGAAELDRISLHLEKGGKQNCGLLTICGHWGGEECDDFDVTFGADELITKLRTGVRVARIHAAVGQLAVVMIVVVGLMNRRGWDIWGRG
jgi:hypothetical protein